METLLSLLVGLLGGAGSAYVTMRVVQERNSLRIKVLEQEVRSLRKRSHEYGNEFASLRVGLGDVQRRLEKMGNGDK